RSRRLARGALQVFRWNGNSRHFVSASWRERAEQSARDRASARRSRWAGADALYRKCPVLGEPRLRGARREQPRLERLRQNILQGRRSEARPGTALGLRRGEEIFADARLRGRKEDRDHGWLLRRLHGPGGAGL